MFVLDGNCLGIFSRNDMNVTCSGFLKKKSILAVTGERDRACNGASFLSAGLQCGAAAVAKACMILLSSEE